MKAARKLNEEEEVVQLGQLHKVTRCMGKKNRGIRSNNQEGDDDRTTISTHTLTGGLNEIKLVRSEAPSNAEQKMDKAISGLRNLILDLQQDIAEDGDDDGSKKMIDELRVEWRALQREHVTMLLKGSRQLMDASSFSTPSTGK